MNAERIVQVAFELNCSPPETAIEFARMLAEHCAQIADDSAGVVSSPAGEAIREAFRTRDPSSLSMNSSVSLSRTPARRE